MLPAPTARPTARVVYKTIAIGGTDVGLLSAGPPDAPPVLLLHGFSGDALTWQYNVGALARCHRVYAVDLPGHGLTGAVAGIGYWRDMVAWLADILGTLGIKSSHLIGHSSGARIVLGLVEAGKAVPPSLTLISCAGISPSYDYAFLTRLTRIESFEDALVCVRQLHGDAPDNPDRMAKALHQRLSHPDVKANLNTYLNYNFVDGALLPESPVAWDAVTCPLQIIWGSDDRIVQLPPADWLPAWAEIHLLDRVGHLPQNTAADRVNRLLLDFTQRHADIPLRNAG